MKGFKWENTLTKYLTTIKTLDEEIESLRVELCSITSFIPSSLFTLLDKDNKTFITLKDFQAFLSSKYISYEEPSLRRFIHNFDKNEDFAINYKEFLDIILPRNNLSLKNAVNQRRETNKKSIDVIIESTFVKLLQQEMKLVKELAYIAEELKNSKDFTTYEAFVCLSQNQKYITKENIDSFLRDKGENVSEKEISTIMFRIDSDNEGKISYDKFIEIFFPFGKFKQTSNKLGQNEIASSSLKESNASKLMTSNPKGESYLKKKNYNIPSNIIKMPSITNKPPTRSFSPLIYNYKKNTCNFPSHIKSSSLSFDNNISADINNKTYVPQTFSKYSNEKMTQSQSQPQFMNVRYSEPTYNYREMFKTYTSPNKKPIIPLYNHQRAYILSSFKMPEIINSPIKSCNYCIDCIIRRNLFNLLNDFIDKDTKVEMIKENLAFCEDANLTDLFNFFDYSQRGSMSTMDISKAFNDLGLYITMRDLALIFKRYDKNEDGELE